MGMFEYVLEQMRNKEWKKMDSHRVAMEFSDSFAALWKVHPFFMQFGYTFGLEK